MEHSSSKGSPVNCRSNVALFGLKNSAKTTIKRIYWNGNKWDAAYSMKRPPSGGLFLRVRFTNLGHTQHINIKQPVAPAKYKEVAI